MPATLCQRPNKLGLKFDIFAVAQTLVGKDVLERPRDPLVRVVVQLARHDVDAGRYADRLALQHLL